MPEKHTPVRPLLKSHLWYSAFGAAVLLFAANSAWAASSEPALKLLNSLPVPVATGNTTLGMYSFDISFVDQATGVYYLADRSNKAVDVVSADSIVTQIFPNNGHAPFAGVSPPAFSTATAGPNGVVAVVRDNLFDNRLGEERVDGLVVTIGEVVGAVRLVDEADIK